MSVLDRTAIVSARPRHKDVEIPGLGTVRVQSLSQFDYYEVLDATLKCPQEEADESDALNSAKLLKHLYPIIVAFAAIDESGARVFSGPDDEAIKALRPSELAAIGNAAYEFWGFSEQPDAVKNSAAVPTS